MCLLILQNGERKLSKKEFNNAWGNNDDGFGMVANIAGQKTLSVIKTMDKTEWWERYKKLIENDKLVQIVLHFRMWTSGHHWLFNVHPFEIADWVYFFHNGVLDIEDTPWYSDTHTLCKFIRSMNLTEEQCFSYEFLYMLEKVAGSTYNKFVLISKKHYAIINEKLGFWEDETWFSNSWHSYCYKVAYDTIKYPYSSDLYDDEALLEYHKEQMALDMEEEWFDNKDEDYFIERAKKKEKSQIEEELDNEFRGAFGRDRLLWE